MGFRRTGRRADRRQHRTKSAADPRRCQPLGRQRPLPRQPQVADEPAGEAKLAVGRCHGPGKPVGLLWGAGPGQGPVQGLLPKADGVLDVEPADVRAPHKRQVRGQYPLGRPTTATASWAPGTAQAAAPHARGPGCQPRSSAARRRRGRCAAWGAAHPRRSRSPARTAGRPPARWPWVPARWPDRPATAWRRGGPDGPAAHHVGDGRRRRSSGHCGCAPAPGRVPVRAGPAAAPGQSRRRRPPAAPAGGRGTGPAARGSGRPRPGCGCPPGQGGAHPPAPSRSHAATPSPRRAGSTSPPRSAARPSAARGGSRTLDLGSTPHRSAPTPSGQPQTPAAHPAGAPPATPVVARPPPRHGVARRTSCHDRGGAAAPTTGAAATAAARSPAARITQLKPRIRPAGRTAVQRGAEALHGLQPLAGSIRLAHTSTSGHHAPPSTWSYSEHRAVAVPRRPTPPARLKAKLRGRS
jgi:hypothetical protein